MTGPVAVSTALRQERARGPATVLAALALPAAIITLLSGCGEPGTTPLVASPPTGASPNLLMVSFDTLRADRLGCYGNTSWPESPSPHVDGLAERGTLFETAIAPRGQTHPSLGALLTAKYPITTGLRENGLLLLPEHRTLFEQLREAGWRTGVFVANFEQGQTNDDWVYRGAEVSSDGFQGGRRREAALESRFQRIWDDRVEQAALDFLSRQDPARPFAAWVHFYNPHQPYNPPAGFIDRYGTAADLPEPLAAPGEDSGPSLGRHLAEITLGDRPVPAAELRRIMGLYDATLHATDLRLQHLLDALKAAGELENTYLVFTSDHGEELFDHNRYFYHGNSIYQGTLRIPLIVSGPGLPAGQRLSVPVQTIDIAPTILDLLGIAPLPGAEGASLLPLLRGETSSPPRPHAFIEWQDLVYAVTDGRWKYVHNPGHFHLLKQPFNPPPGRQATRGFRIDCFEAYDLARDPTEQVNLLAGLDPSTLADPAALPAEIRALRLALERWLADPRHEREMSWPGMSAQAMQRMEEIGYVGALGRKDVLPQEPCGTR
ncbi:MAG: sulfatase family protein [Planctomycetota bacterium]